MAEEKQTTSSSIPVLRNRKVLLFLILGGFFVTNALVAEFIGVKIFALEDTLGIEPFNWNLFGEKGSLNFTAGVLLWPVVFIMTDVINEYYGRRGVQFLSYLTVFLIGYSFVMISFAIGLVPASWWVADYQSQGISNMQDAFAGVFGQGLWIIAGSISAFLIGQLLDAQIFYAIKRVSGDGYIWMRATVSTLFSQLIDSIVVLYIAFVLGQGWDWNLFLAVATVNYGYKVFMAIVLIPLLYFFHFLIERFLGKERAQELRREALGLADKPLLQELGKEEPLAEEEKPPKNKD